MKGWINGIGWVTAAGYGAGRHSDQQPLCPGVVSVPKRKQIFTKPDLRFGRLDEFSRVGLGAIALCLRDGGAEEWDEKRQVGIVAASKYGCLQTDIAYLETMIPDNGALSSPKLFVYTLSNSFLGEAALRFGLTGNTLVLNQADETGGLAAVRYALEDLSWSEQPAIVTGICDLAPPIELSIEGEYSGGLFMLIGREPSTDVTSYGEVELWGDEIFFAREKVDDFRALVGDCLAALPR
ncbi:MAG: beta-ketoacyl synthase N-terminal-like domain-containing protein [Thermodesulfobacteriota bacterium]|nr:beta-ketoacyl synthase N-terminal-like domain-containing protein [Thermodesulfobacteriota bacterium]